MTDLTNETAPEEPTVPEEPTTPETPTEETPGEAGAA